MKITGTFLDEITHDIPSQNWGPKEWDLDFQAMKRVGIDTVILIRSGYQNKCTFPSTVLKSHPSRIEMPLLPVYTDLVDLYLTLAEKYGMHFYFGTYDSGTYWHSGQYEKETELNLAVCEEFFNKYGHRKAFQGWYITHEIHTHSHEMMKIYEKFSHHLRALKNVPILMSPYVKGKKQFGAEAIELKQHEKEWSNVFSSLSGLVDIVAFQDGQIGYEELPDYLELNQRLANKHGLRCWSNLESFDRDMPIKFPPIDFRYFQYKMEQAAKAKVEKLITFEFSHFMSPNSCYPSAHHFYNRYLNWLEQNKGSIGSVGQKK